MIKKIQRLLFIILGIVILLGQTNVVNAKEKQLNENYTVLTEGKNGSTYFIYSVILAIIVLFNHRSNIKRILNGTENKLGSKEKK